MEDSQNGAALPQGGEPQPPREQASQKNHTNGAAGGEASPAACRTHQVKSQHAAESNAEAEAPETNSQPESRKENRKPGRKSPFDPFWDTEIVPLLERDLAGEITTAGILNELLERHPEAFQGKHRKYLLDTLGRRIRAWRTTHRRGLPKRWKRCPRSQKPGRRGRRPMTVLPQDHPPGKEAQVDFTDCKKLAVTIQGKPFPHELFVFRLSYSGWTYVEVFQGETVSALMQGLQNAMRELGGVPQVVRSDNRRNAIRNKQPIEPYGAFLKHYALKLSLINYGRPRENGGVEGENGRVKEDISQALLIHDCRDFESEEDYKAFVAQVVDLSNRRDERLHKHQEECANLRPLPDTPAPEYINIELQVDNYSCINVYSCRYSVPCRAIGQDVTVQLYAEHLEVYDGKRRQLTTWRRRHGNNEFIIHYPHLFPDLMINWGGFAGLPPEYKEQLFPRPSLRTAHEKLREWDPNGEKTNGMNADYQYVRILHLAAKADLEEAVDQALQQLLKAGDPFGFEDVKRLVVSPSESPEGSATEDFDPLNLNDEPPVTKPLF